MAAVCILLASCATQTVKQQGDQPGASSSAAPAKKTATLGTPITLKGQQSGEQLRVTLVKVTYPAPPKDEFSAPDAGKAIAAVQIKIDNTGTAAYSDSPGNGAKLFDASNQQYSEEIGHDTAAGAMLGTDLKLAVGGSALGYIDFQVPSGTKLQRFQYTPNSGFGPDTGEWTIT